MKDLLYCYDFRKIIFLGDKDIPEKIFAIEWDSWMFSLLAKRITQHVTNEIGAYKVWTILEELFEILGWNLSF